MKKTLALLLAVALIVGFMPVTAKADNEPASVTVYVSYSEDGEYIIGCDSKAIAFKKITVPYFDLADYGLQDFYYNLHCYDAEDYNPENQIPGTSTTANGKVTLLHVLIYLMEVYDYNESGGTGYLYNTGDPTNPRILTLEDSYDSSNSFYGSGDIHISGYPGSLYFESYWGMDENFNYFVNYEYPEAYSGWGRTADQIVLNDNDIITIGHFSDWNAYLDPIGIFSFASRGGVSYPYITTNGSDTLTFAHASQDWVNFTGTTYNSFNDNIPIYYHSIDDITSGDVTDWTYIGTTNANGQITINTATWNNGTYVVAMPGQYGVDDPLLNLGTEDSICCAPGGIIIKKGVS